MPLVSTRFFSLKDNFIYNEHKYCIKNELQYLITESDGFVIASNDILGSYINTENIENFKEANL